MFGIGFEEFLLIIIIAILFLGPEKLPDTMVKVARFIKSVKKVMSDAQHTLESEMRIADIKEEALSYKKQLDEATNELQSFKNHKINPTEEIEKAMQNAKSSFERTDIAAGENIEPKRETVTFKKQSADKEEA
ncbi:MAG: Sec-independent protein translocase protein TatB [Sulfurovaceae bacterium]|nr:Sec-independent protein translocase protein TatB [Sulfurovaceae bacterium]